MKVKKKRSWNWSLLIVPLILALMAFFLFPLPRYIVESPGKAADVGDMIKVGDKTDHNKGELMLTTVRLRQATPYLYLKTKWDDSYQLEKKEDVMGQASNEEYMKLQDYYMETSENAAKAMALKAAHRPYKIKFQGIYVLDISSSSHFNKKLKVGDLITAFNQRHFDTTEEAIRYIQQQKVGANMTLTYQRNGKTHHVSAPLMKMKATGKAGIGITLVTKSSIASKPTIDIDAGDIGGPSAGMMFTLQTYELLTGKDLEKGRKIAGTGEMLMDGTIGRIGGIGDKVVAAHEAGAEIFLAPDDNITKEMKKANPHIQTNYQEACHMAEQRHYKMKIIPVKTLQDAIHYLEKSAA